VVGALHEVAIQIGLPEEEAMRTIQSGLESGKREPRKLPDISSAVAVAVLNGPQCPKELWEATPEEQEALYNAVLEERGIAISAEELNAYSLPSGPKFECHLPNEHFIQRFMAYGSDISDAYTEYWFAAGVFVLAVIADKKIKIILKQGTITLMYTYQ